MIQSQHQVYATRENAGNTGRGALHHTAAENQHKLALQTIIGESKTAALGVYEPEPPFVPAMEPVPFAPAISRIHHDDL